MAAKSRVFFIMQYEKHPDTGEVRIRLLDAGRTFAMMKTLIARKTKRLTLRTSWAKRSRAIGMLFLS